jgi:hypothetical protein
MPGVCLCPVTSGGPLGLCSKELPPKYLMLHGAVTSVGPFAKAERGMPPNEIRHPVFKSTHHLDWNETLALVLIEDRLPWL